MAIKEHVDIVKKDHEAIKRFCIKHTERLDLSGADFSGYDFSGLHLFADFTDCNLVDCRFTHSTLTNSLFVSANLIDTDFGWADLRDVTFTNANLTRADLRHAVIEKANFFSATLADTFLPLYQVCPEEGSFVCYKKVSAGYSRSYTSTIVKLHVPASAKRCSALGSRKIRVEKATVLSGEGYSMLAPRAELEIHYKPGKKVRAHEFDPDIRVTCSSGISAFLTRQEAQDY